MMESSMKVIPVTLMTLALSGCAAHYATPGPAARLGAIADITAAEQARAPGSANPKDIHTDTGVREILDKKPLATFPANVAVVRVQGPGYTSYTTTGWGRGAYTVITEREVESETDS